MEVVATICIIPMSMAITLIMSAIGYDIWRNR